MSAPSGGVVVTLSSSNTAVATVPASVTVPAGQISANFTINTSVVASSSTVTITGTYNSANKTCSLTVLPTPSLTGLSISPASVEGGSTATGTVTISSAAPSVGIPISLASANTAVATVPASVTVTSGNTTASFTINTSPVGSQTSVTITATYGANSPTASLQVNPPNFTGFTISPNSTNGGQTVTGTLSFDGPVASNQTCSLSCDTANAVWVLGSNNSTTLLTGSAQNFNLTANATSTAYSFVTSTVNSTVTVNITATYNGHSYTTALTLTPAYLHVTSIYMPSTLVLSWNSTATGNFLLYRAPVTNGVVGTLSLLATLPNTTYSYTDASGFTSGNTLYYRIVDSNNQSAILSDEEVTPYQTADYADQSVDSRIDPRYSTNVYLDYNFATSVYRGGMFVGYATDPARTGRSFARFQPGSAPSGMDFRVGDANLYFTGALTTGGNPVTVAVGCQAITDTNWAPGNVVWDTQPFPMNYTFNPASATNFQSITYNPASPQFGWYAWDLSAAIKTAMLNNTWLTAVWAGQTDTTPGWLYFARQAWNSGSNPPTLMSAWDYVIPITVSLSPTSVHVARSGTSSTITGTVTLNGIGLGNTANVSLSCPNTYGYTLNTIPASFTANGLLSSRTFTFTVTAPANQANGTYTLSIQATANNYTAAANLTVITP